MNNNSISHVRARLPAGGRGGFTLIETAVAVVVVGLGVGAVLISAAAGSRVNDYGKKITQGTFLAQEVREWTLRLPFSDPDAADMNNPPGPDGSDPQYFVDDLDDLLGNDLTGTTYSPPHDGQGSAIADMVGWSQYIDLTWRNPNDLSSVINDGGSDVVFAEVVVSWKGEEIVKAGWLITQRE